ncbi:MAG: shikimate dehydrogenase [Ginsengibacter sp.]
MAMKIYGLVGKSLSHSFSKDFFSRKFLLEDLKDIIYENFELKEFNKEIIAFKNQIDLKGFNITIPYKESIIPYLDDASETCLQIGSCNCVKVESGRWVGYNTDVTGFKQSFEPHLKSCHQKALVLGSGGASKAVCFVLNQLGIHLVQVSRNPNREKGQITYSEVNEALLSQYKIVINTTPIGMFPLVNGYPILPYNAITNEHYFFDLVYNPAQTEFLNKAKHEGAFIKNGSEMLQIQAEESWKIWNT